MPTSPIGTTPGGSVADLIQDLKTDLAASLPTGERTHHVKSAGTEATNSAANVGRPTLNSPSGPTPVTDVASVLLSEVATSDLSKLSKILDPAPDAVGNKVLDALLARAVQEVVKGNGERAIGYLADYATRDPRRAEALPLQPELEPVRDKIDSMVSRMAMVAKMSAEEGLSRAEQSASELAGKLADWDTNADVLVKVAHRLLEAGGYANYSRSAEVAKIVSSAGTQAKPGDQVLAAAAAANVSAIAASQNAAQMVAGVNVPYWVAPDFPYERIDSRRPIASSSRISSGSGINLHQNAKALKEISSAALHQLWLRAPLLVMLLSWLSLGLIGGITFSLGSRIWPEGLLVELGNVGFTVWSLGFLAMVGFGFYARTRRIPRR